MTSIRAKIVFTLCVIISAMLSISCVEVLGVGDELEPLVTVNCLLDGNAEVQTLELTYSGSMSVKRPEYEPVTDAEAVLYEEGREAGRFEKTEEPSKWVLAFKPTEGKKYRLEVSVPGRGPIAAETTMPDVVPVEFALQHNYYGDVFDPFLGKAVFRFCDQPFLRYYKQVGSSSCFWVFILHRFYHESGLLITRYKLNHKEWMPPEGRYRSIAPEIGTNHPGADDFNSTGRSICYPIYPRDRDLKVYWDMDGIGGVFGVEEYSLYNTDCSGRTMEHKFYLRVGETKVSSPDSISFFVAGRAYDSNFVFRAVSPEYDRYLREGLKDAFSFYSEVPFEAWFEEKTLYGNVSGGLGIFGAYIDKVL